MIERRVLDPERERLRVHAAVAFMVAGALEVQTRLARELDPELHKLLSAAHGQALHVMARERRKLQEHQARPDSPKAEAAS